MAKGRIRVLSAIPGPTSLRPIVRDFAKRREGVVTAFSDALLPVCADLIGDDSLLEVKPFGELVRQTLEMSGEEVYPLAQSSQCLSAVASVVPELGVDSPFWKTRRFAGLHESLWETLKELREWRIDAEECRRIAELAGPRLAQKLRDMAFVSDQVQAVLYDVGRQTHAAQLAASLGSALERDGAFDRLLVFAGSKNNPARIDWIKWVADSGVDVTVVVDRHATGAPLFEGAAEMIRRLGAPVVETGDAHRLARNLFTEPVHGGAPIEAEIVSAADKLAEVEWALRGCAASDNPTQAAIFVRDLESYAPLIEIAAKRLDTPVRMPRRAPLLTNAFARLTLTTLRFCASNDVRTIGPIVRSSYLGLSQPDRAALESEIREAHRTRGGQWAALQELSVREADKHPWLQKVLEWRAGALAESATVAEWSNRLRLLIDVLPWHDSLSGSGSYSVDRDRRAQNQLQRVLAAYSTIDQARTPVTKSLSEFASLAHRLWEDADVSLPMAESGVVVAANAEQLGDAESLFVLGMLEGVFPRRRREDPILTDDERIEISQLRPGEPALTTSIEIARAERDEFYRVCAAAGAKVVFSYPLTDDDRDNIPAYYLDKVREAVAVTGHNYRRSELAPALGECVAPADEAMRRAIDGPREEPLANEILTEAARQAIRAVPADGLGPDELRDALICPFMQVSRYRLRLHPKRRGTRWFSLSKLPQRATLPTQLSTEQAESALLAALDAELDRLYSDVPAWEMQLLASGGRRLIRDWVRREFVSRETWEKDADSTLMNVGFGSHGLRDEMPGGVRIAGVAPALSRMNDTSVLHLYGGHPRNADELTDSERLFLGLHFLALHQPGKEVALEVDGIGSKRVLYLLTRAGTRPVTAQTKEGLEVKDLSTDDDPAVSKRDFFDKVKTTLRGAAAKISLGQMEAVNGDQCDRCDYGELCRRSKLFGEEDLLFGRDEEAFDG